jgi:cyclopropane-fatty-acyl-phospholipid synthase
MEGRPVLDARGSICTTTLLECKTASAFSASQWGREGTDEVPHAYLVQCAWYTTLTGCSQAHLAVLLGNSDLRIYTVVHDPALGERLVNWQSQRRAHQVARCHYDIDPRIYAAMLDSRRIYSCAYWQMASDLEQAQEDKLKLICEKLQLEPGQRLLDLGCGWGGFALYAAENYGVEVLGITVSQQQQRYVHRLSTDLPVRTLLADYRSRNLRDEKPFDRIVSIGMMEHVGRLNDHAFFKVANDLLADDGLMLLQTIGNRQTTCKVDPWIDAYIFPNGRLPSAQQLCRGFESFFILQDWENLGHDYDKTLMAWWANFDSSWSKLSQDISPSFYRLWSYYLLSCAGLFRSGQGQLWQLVLSKASRKPAYRSIRLNLCSLRSDSAASVPQLGS